MSVDVRDGDLIKFTHREDPEITFTTRARSTWTEGTRRFHSRTLDTVIFVEDYHVEILDRPLPPIDEELVKSAAEVYYRTTAIDRADIKAVINLVREYDRKNNTKENA